MVINYVIYSNGSHLAFLNCTGENILVIGNITCVYGKFPLNTSVSTTRSNTVCKYILIVYKANNYSVLPIVKQVTSESTSLNIGVLSIASSTFTIIVVAPIVITVLYILKTKSGLCKFYGIYLVIYSQCI